MLRVSSGHFDNYLIKYLLSQLRGNRHEQNNEYELHHKECVHYYDDEGSIRLMEYVIEGEVLDDTHYHFEKYCSECRSIQTKCIVKLTILVISYYL